MSVTAEQLDAFHHFCAEELANGATELSWDDLFIRWESCHQRDNVNSAIREGLADIDAGRFQSAEDALSDIQDDVGISA